MSPMTRRCHDFPSRLASRLVGPSVQKYYQVSNDFPTTATLPAPEHVGELSSGAARFTLAREVYLKPAVTSPALVSCHGNMFLLSDESGNGSNGFYAQIGRLLNYDPSLIYLSS